MSTEKDFIDSIAQVRASGEQITFAELLAKTLNGKIVEVYIGDNYENVNYDDATVNYAAVLVGKVVAAYAECLVLNCVYVDPKTKGHKFGNIVCLNERAIRTITEVDDTGVLKDTFLSTRDSRLIKDLFDGK